MHSLTFKSCPRSRDAGGEKGMWGQPGGTAVEGLEGRPCGFGRPLGPSDGRMSGTGERRW